jgi:hypothetical protein
MDDCIIKSLTIPDLRIWVPVAEGLMPVGIESAESRQP